jgi:2-polyprenyl-3-methyl-5-hydroxy-6-metoxy-1,4-benzoquinol methylase
LHPYGVETEKLALIRGSHCAPQAENRASGFFEEVTVQGLPILLSKLTIPDTKMPATETTLLQSWHHNAQSWIDAVRTGAIESRHQVTDQAILLAILGRQPERVLDLGCGEGWLLRALAARTIEAVGVDGDATLVESARAAGASPVYLASYDELVEAKVDIGSDYNLICANFALLHQDIIPLLAAMNALLAPGGALIIQTLHPWTAAAGDYQDGWREETFAGFKGLWQPMPWYFRTLSSWLNALDMAGFRLTSLQEPQHPQSPVPQSLLLVAESDR